MTTLSVSAARIVGRLTGGNLAALTASQAWGMLERTTNPQTGTSYTLLLTDAQKIVTLSNGSAITLTVPTNASVAFAVGTEIRLVQLGAGQVTVAGAGGVTVNGTPGLKARAQYSAIRLTKYLSDTWVLDGDCSA